MQTEIEAKFLNVDADDLQEKLKKIGASMEYGETLMRRKTYDDKNGDLRKIGGWVRVRDEGDKVTLSYKQLNDRTVHGTKEVTVIVDDFDTTNILLESIGFIQKSYQETKREKWVLGTAEITIDTWPWIPTFVEIEASDESSLKGIAAQLGFDWNNALHGSVETAYQAVYDVTDDEIDGWKHVTFTPVPDWLEERRLIEVL